MPCNKIFHNRKSIRLPGYDYAQASAYFVTICAHQRADLFGEVVRGEMHLNDMGALVAEEWIKTESIRSEILLDEWVIMPNHFHAIIMITDGAAKPHIDFSGYDNCHTRAYCDSRAYCHTPLRSPSKNLGAVVRGFKSAATRLINQWRKSPSTPVWQRNYYEHIIRNEDELQDIRKYIQNNPLRWEADSLYSGEIST